MSSNDKARDEREWERAFALRRDLAPYLQTGFRTKAALMDFCRSHKCSRATAYRWLAIARRDDSATALRRVKTGPKRMSVGLSDQHEKIIREVLRREFLTRNQIPAVAALKAVNHELTQNGLKPVSRSTLRRRIETFPDSVLSLKRHGGSAARHAYRIVRGRFIVNDALAVVQIDHTLLDLMVVDPDTRACIGRPYLTVLLDLATRMPTGMFLSTEAPSATNLMIAFWRSVFPKADYLAGLGIRHEWPVYGLPLTISSDNGADLTSKAFNRGLAEYGVDHIFRPVAQPHLGGHIERFIGTIQRFAQTLPATTFSSVEKKGTFQPERQACLTLLDTEKLILNFLLGQYAHDHKRALQTTPMRAWDRYWNEQQSLPRLPKSPARFRLDFLPFEQRKIRREGLELFGMFYRSPQLQKMKNCGVASVIVKYDPTDIRTVHISADDEIYHDARAEHFPRNPLSLDEWNDLKRKREDRVASSLTAPSFAAAHDFQKQILRDAKKQTRSAAEKPSRAIPPATDIRQIDSIGRDGGKGGRHE